MPKVLRVECIEVNFHPSLSKLCHQAKNLYNRANFLIKQALKKKDSNKNLVNYYTLNSLLKGEECYKVLPAHTAQHTLKLLCRNWKSFFQAKKEWKNHPGKFHAIPRPPGYKPSKGEIVAILTNQQVKLRDRWLTFPQKVGFYYKTRLNPRTTLKEVRVVPRQIGYTLEVVYEKLLPNQRKKFSRKGAIDLGSVNLVTFVDNLGNQPIVIKDHGKGVKSIIQYYLKIQKKLREIYVQQQKKQLQQQNRLIYGQSFYHHRERFRKKLKNALHHLTNYLVDLWVELNLHEVVIGYNPQWKQQVNLGKKTTQLFVSIPFHKIIHQLKYKGEERGILVSLIPEHHTSKCSFLDNEFSQHYDTYVGKRISRGLFTSALGYKINADVNAAFNILVKSDPNALPPRSAKGVGRYVMYPRSVCVDPQGMTFTLAMKEAQLGKVYMPT